MTSRRGRARLISEYVDARIGRRETDTPKTTPPSADFDELLDLARDLSDIDLLPPRGAEEAVLQQISRDVTRQETPQKATWWNRAFFHPLWLPVAASLVLVAVVGAVLWTRFAQPTLSATDLLARIDRLDSLATPGELLHIVERSTMRGPVQGREVENVSNVHLWFDPATHKTAAQGRDSGGRLQWAEVTFAEEGDVRSRLYLAPDAAVRPMGQLVIRPSDREYLEALKALTDEERRLVAPLVAKRRLVYEPVWSDRHENRILLGLEFPGLESAETLDLQPWTTPDGGRGYRLHAVTTRRPWLEWSGGGITSVAARFERTRLVAADTYLTVRDTSVYHLADGRVFSFERERLHVSRQQADASGESVFTLPAAPDTPVYRPSALEELRLMAKGMQKP